MVSLPIKQEHLDKLKSLTEYRVQPYRKDKQTPVDFSKEFTYLVTIEGEDMNAQKVKRDAENQRLLWSTEDGEYECKITSDPIVIDNTHLYFTRAGFLGTMALHKDTLLDSDKYSAPETALDDDADEEDKAQGWEGEVELSGSKETLRTSNEALLEQKLLKPSSMDKTKMIGLIAAGAIIGFVVATQYGGA